MIPAPLAIMAWPAVAEGAAGWVLAVPLGSTEQHGPHLPLSTDTTIAEALAHRLAASRGDVVVGPAIAFGASGEHAGFPGTLSIGTDALRAVLIELVRSADVFRSVVVVNGHGGNAAAVRDAVAQLTAEGRRVLAWSPRPAVIEGIAPVDAHAGRTETSIMLALVPAARPALAIAGAPALVAGAASSTSAEAGETRPLSEIFADLVAGGVVAVSANGVLGDPAGASAAEGEALLDALAADLLTAVDQHLADTA